MLGLLDKKHIIRICRGKILYIIHLMYILTMYIKCIIHRIGGIKLILLRYLFLELDESMIEE